MNGEKRNDMICQLEACDNIYVTAQHYKEDILIHVRKYEDGPMEKKIPTKTGATIPIHRLKGFIESIDDTDEAIKKFIQDKSFSFRKEFGANWCVTLEKYPLINIRRWFRLPSTEEMLPTKSGIALTFFQWNKVKDCMLIIKSDFLTDTQEVAKCPDGKDLMSCSKCLCDECF